MDDSFFKELVSNLAFLTKVRYVFISQINDERPTEYVDTMAFCANGDFIENIRYAFLMTALVNLLKY